MSEKQKDNSIARLYIGKNGKQYGELKNEFGTWNCTAEGELFRLKQKRDITKVVVPKEIAGIPIRKICTCTFATGHCYSLEEIFIQDSVEELDKHFIGDCYELKKITIPKSVQKVNGVLFSHCPVLETIIIGEEIKEIVNGPRECVTFNGKTILEGIEIDNFGAWHYTSEGAITKFVPKNKDITEVEVPSYIGSTCIKKIDEYAFVYCSRLKKLIISEGIEELGYCGFDNYSDLEEVVVPKSIKKTNECPFGICSKLKKATLGEDVVEIKSKNSRECIPLNGHTIFAGLEVDKFGTWCYTADGVIVKFERNNGIEKAVVPTKIKNIPIKKIGVSAFYCSGLKSLTIPACIKEVRPSAFTYCSGMNEIIISCPDVFDSVKQALLTSSGIISIEQDFPILLSLLLSPITIRLREEGQKEISVTVRGRKQLKNLTKWPFMKVNGISLKQIRDKINLEKTLGSIGIIAGITLAAMAFVFFAPIVAAAIAVAGAAFLVAGSIIIDKAREAGNKQDFYVATNEEKNPDIKQIAEKSVAKDMQWRSWFKKAKDAKDIEEVNKILEPMISGKERN